MLAHGLPLLLRQGYGGERHDLLLFVVQVRLKHGVQGVESVRQRCPSVGRRGSAPGRARFGHRLDRAIDLDMLMTDLINHCHLIRRSLGEHRVEQLVLTGVMVV